MSDRTQHNTEKLVRLVQYLRAISTLTAQTVRTLDQYNTVLWLPPAADPAPDIGSNEQDGSGDSCWLDIKKTEKPSLPLPPEQCRKWVEEEVLNNLDAPPVLRLPEPPNTLKKPGQDSLYADAVARKEKQWQEYIDQQWRPWQEKCQDILSQEKIYTDLFRLYQEQQKLGEQYELVLGLGLLSWET
ncbi:MAG: hypothetical protein D3916_16510, partial [Candidatus Electrothrix sp. MAN1_4]|nr:hypothetical protein [Candidatus Electrothrix sp. MAN1_4]